MHKSIPQNHLCSLVLLGNLVNKPEIRYQTNPITAIAELTLATHRKWYDQNTKKYKEWTHFHTIKMIGDVVERSLLQAEKGDLILIKGYLVNSKKSNREIIHATYAHRYPKGYARSINQLHCSGKIIEPVKLVQTENNQQIAELTLNLNFYAYSAISQELRCLDIARKLHIWDKQAEYLNENAEIGDELIVDAKLSYLNNNLKSQLIDAQHVVLQKTR